MSVAASPQAHKGDKVRPLPDNPVMPSLTSSSRPRAFLFDGMAMAYRAHFAFLRNPLRNAQGVDTSAVFGFLASLDRVLEDEAPEAVVVVFDAPEPTFRHRAYPQYKATRDKMPEELIPQLDWIRRAVEAYGLPFIRKSGFEADDVIGTLAKTLEAEGHDVWIVSGDKDMMQLVTPHTRMYNLMKPGQSNPVLVGEADVVEKFGVAPSKVIDVLGLMGDASDNVPGVPGVGPKTATKLVGEYGSLEAVLKAADGLKQKKLRENLLEHADKARLSLSLVTIDTDVPLDDVTLRAGERNVDALATLYRELDFHARLDQLSVAPVGGAHSSTSHYELVDTKEKLDALVQELADTKGRDGFAFDTETTSIDPFRAELVGLSFSWKAGHAFYVPVNLDPPLFGGAATRQTPPGMLFAESGASGDTDAILDVLRPMLEDPEIPKCGQNMKYDVHVLRTHGVHVRGLAFDTMIASFCSDPGQRAHNLDSLALRRLGIRKIPTSDLIGKGKSQISMRDVPIDVVSKYACEDADVTWQLKKSLAPELEERDVRRVFDEAEMPLLPVLVRMEAHGIGVNGQKLAHLGKTLGARIVTLEDRIHELAGEPFNIRSTQTLGRILFEDLKLHEHETVGRKRPKRTAKGKGYATDETTLLELVPAHELPALVLEYRSLSKLKSTYVDTLPSFVHPQTGRIHTSYHQTGAATGRLSSSDPNLQNIPIRTDEGRAIREAFVPDAGYVFVSADYSQIELRLLAHLSGDEGLKEAFQEGIDIHRATAARIFDVAPADVTPELRSRAKAVNFGVIYGMGAQRLARQTGVTLKEARGFIDGYFESYKGVRDYLEDVKEGGRTRGYVTTMLGRRRYLPGLLDEDGRIRSQAENVAVNTPVQGTAADLIKMAMIHIDDELRRGALGARMLLQIHDELLFEVPEDEVEATVSMVRLRMEGALPLDVPVVVDVGTGTNWSEAH